VAKYGGKIRWEIRQKSKEKSKGGKSTGNKKYGKKSTKKKSTGKKVRAKKVRKKSKAGQGLFRSRDFVTSGEKGPTRVDIAQLTVFPFRLYGIFGDAVVVIVWYLNL
jgi:hypothetical protein